ncbi:hypothetical protein EAI_04563 [Harpegnathos saltator]|nr:hypothetical protein EAI_04563 [Harpegnathos saltator]
MSSTMVSRRLLGCLFVILLSRYGDAYKSNSNDYLEAILMTLERIENGMQKMAEQSALACMTQFSHEKLAALASDRSKIPDDDEAQSAGRTWSPRMQSMNLMNVRRSMSRSDEDDDYQPTLRKLKRHRSSNRNQNVNSNSNINTNINSNRAKIFDLSNETTS